MIHHLFLIHFYDYLTVSLACGGSASQNQTYLVQSSVTSLTSPCSYTICPCSSNICRIRFDFTVWNFLSKTEWIFRLISLREILPWSTLGLILPKVSPKCPEYVPCKDQSWFFSSMIIRLNFINPVSCGQQVSMSCQPKSSQCTVGTVQRE